MIKEDPGTNEELMDAYKLLASVIPSNPFYQERLKTLQPMATMSWEAWEQSNRLSKLTCTDRIYAHVFRDYIIYMNECSCITYAGI